MSIEFESAVDENFDGPFVQRLKADIAARSVFRIVRDGGAEFRLGKVLSDGGAKDQELITVSVEEKRVYVAFHGSTRTEMDSFLRVLKNFLAAEGISADFEEL